MTISFESGTDISLDAIGADISLAGELKPSGRPTRKNVIASVVGPLVFLAVFLALWEYMHLDGMRRFFDKPGFLLPSVVTVIDQSFLDSNVRQQMITGLGWTTFAALSGLAISVVLGITFAVLMAQARWIERSMYPYLVAAQALPVLAVVPLIGSVFGGGLSARIFVCVLISIFPIVTNTLFGLTAVEKSQHELFTLHGVSRSTRLRKLQFPSAMPSIFIGFRISAGLSVIGAIVGEQFFRAGQAGYRRDHRTVPPEGPVSQVYGGLMVAAALGIAVFFAFGALRKVVIGRWYDDSQ